MFSGFQLCIQFNYHGHVGNKMTRLVIVSVSSSDQRAQGKQEFISVTGVSTALYYSASEPEHLYVCVWPVPEWDEQFLRVACFSGSLILNDSGVVL
jgi:hypothetical protein